MIWKLAIKRNQLLFLGRIKSNKLNVALDLPKSKGESVGHVVLVVLLRFSVVLGWNP